MSSQYRICHNCGASLTANEAYCPRCGAQYVEPIVQQPGEFEPFPPEQPSASEPTEPHAAQPQQPVIIPPPPQSQASYPPQGQGYAPPPSTPASYGQQMPVTPGQMGGPPQPPTSDTDNRLRMNLIIGLIVVVVILLLAIGGFFIFSNQKNNPSPATTPTPGVTPTPTPTSGTTPTPTPTSVPFQVTTIDISVNPLTIAGMSCGTQLTVTYTATFNVLPKGPGGAVQFTYTTDGGRTSKTGLVQFNPGQTNKQFQFTSSGTLALNGAFPGSGQVTTTSPNVVSSQTAIPSGSCTPVPSATP